ncbi:hypothetical protein ACOMHN_011182 [Nucella lapillus]
MCLFSGGAAAAVFPALPVFQRPPPHRCSLPRPHLLLIQPTLQQTHPAPHQLHRDKDARAADSRMTLTCRFPQEQWVAAEQYFKVAL